MAWELHFAEDCGSIPGQGMTAVRSSSGG